MPEPDAQTAPPAGGSPPPAPPATGEPEDRPDPSDPGPPITVVLEGVPLGDLGSARVDSRLLMGLLLREGEVAAWLSSRTVEGATVEIAFPGSRWPLQPALSRHGEMPDPSHPAALIGVDLETMHLGDLGDRDTDARLLSAIVLRNGRVGAWLQRRGVDATTIETAFGTTGWD